LSDSHVGETRAAVPAWLVGIWRRDNIELSGAPDFPVGPFETASVVWFQGRTRYADLRLPLGPVAPFSEEEAFGGRQHWADPRLRFGHELDRSGRLAEDEGDLELRGEVLVETGTFIHAGRPCRYVERWRRMTALAPAVEVHELLGGDGRIDGLCLRIEAERLLLRRCAGGVCARHDRVGSAVTIGALGDPGPPPGSGSGHEPAWRCIEAIDASRAGTDPASPRLSNAAHKEPK